MDKKAFVKKFDKFLTLSGKNYVEDLAKIMDVTLETELIWKDSISLIEEDINKFISISKEPISPN